MSVVSPDSFYVDFLNPSATNYVSSLESSLALRNTAGIPEINSARITDYPNPDYVQRYVNDGTLIYSGGGDTTVNLTVSAIIGNVLDDPEASANNTNVHSALAEQVLYVAGADGNGNNFSQSALGRHAHNPAAALLDPRSRVGYHHPALFEVADDRGNTVHSGIVTSCIGLGGAALAAANMDEVKPRLKELRPAVRLVREGVISLDTLLKAPGFSVTATRTDTTGSVVRKIEDISGFEMIGSHIYAKAGRTEVNIDDYGQQFVIQNRPEHRSKRVASVATTLARVKLGRHVYAPTNFDDSTRVSVLLTSEKPVRFHVDGELGMKEDYELEPGQTLHLRRSQIGVPTLLAN